MDELDRNLDQWESVKAQADKGISCPCCGRLVKRYRRKLHTEMALFMLRLYHMDQSFPQQFHSTKILIPATCKASTDGAYLHHWDLAESMDGKSGYYRITSKGIDFVLGKITVPERIVLLCGDFEGFEGDQITIQQALSNKFSYTQLMQKMF